MKQSEFKFKVVNSLLELVDTYFGSSSISDKFINSTLKIIIKQNQNKYDSILELFTDENGCIDPQMIIDEYIKVLDPDGFILDIRDFIKSDPIRNMMPNKALKITREDIENIFKN